MWDFFKSWCGTDTALGRFSRTVAQGVVGVLVANVDWLVNSVAGCVCVELGSETKAVIVALVMAVLAPAQKVLADEGEN